MSFVLLFFFLLFSVLAEGSGRGKKRKKKGEDSESSEEGSDDERPRKRGRPKNSGAREHIKGFTDVEVSKSKVYNDTEGLFDRGTLAALGYEKVQNSISECEVAVYVACKHVTPFSISCLICSLRSKGRKNLPQVSLRGSALTG